VRAFERRWAPRLLAPLLCLSLAPIAAPSVAAMPVSLRSLPTAATHVVAASTIQPGSVNRSSLNLAATYAVSATLEVGTGVLRVRTTITARNDSGAGIDRIELNTIAARLGAISITSASVDGSSRSVTVSDQTLIVPLGGVLPDGATVEVKVAYRATLKNSFVGSNWLFTRSGGTISMYRWIPWVSAARPFDRPNHGDPFVTPSSPQVDISLTLDKARILAAPVARLPKTASKTWAFTVHDVRDVNLVLAPDFSVTTANVDGITIRAYSRPGGISGTNLANQAKLALDREAARLGVPYAWTSLTIVETGAGGYGMESPRMVWIPSSTLSANLSYLVHHEVAHQWFYGLVGNDQQREPFADEAAADLLARTVLGTLRSSRCATDALDRRITQYSAACYYETIYIQGGNTLNQLRIKMGTALFWHTMKAYVLAYGQKLGGTKLLLDRLQGATPVDLGPTLRARFPSLY
jgi:hypothetical protein